MAEADAWWSASEMEIGAVVWVYMAPGECYVLRLFTNIHLYSPQE